MDAKKDRPTVDELLARVEDAWRDPARLRALVHDALDDGFGAEILPAARRVREIDPDLDRGVLLYALALRGCARHEQAEKILIAHVKARGGRADLWFALAPLASWRGSVNDVNTALDNALLHDPDHADALTWGWKFQSRQHEDGGEHADQWLADRSGAGWRAGLMLGERALHHGRTDAALELFERSCDRAPRRAEPLLRAARALAGAGLDEECARLVLAHWSGSRGPWPLIELIEAQLRLGRIADAAFALARLRGVRDLGDAAPAAAEVSRRAEAARLAAGL
ncbi:hypothetical protein [Nocardiopsis ansamitocini]|uniref:Tetratricopeptide repeat protein n=1 Tax=Nocardiopsis ansamitocini TaxID=1670832 RepID=A0A9W6UKF8_9ACTN|nr:hypothetical protein [Nocardiopsis ansamitocini]GLU49697.1 hypothetical protein Nans01_40480 [Nocardiopsis ansamitocini]